MLDIAFIRKHPDVVKRAAKAKRITMDIDRLLALDERRRMLQREKEQWAQKRNVRARMSARGEQSRREGKTIKETVADLEAKFRAVDQEFQKLLRQVPNVPTSDTPEGKSESDNKVVRTVGEQPQFDFPPKEHWELGPPLGMDTERAASVSGSRFAYLKGDLARLEFALVNYALSVLTSADTLAEILTGSGLAVPSLPFTPVVPPVLIKPEVFEKMARLEPREERYYIPRDDLFLVGSAEHTLGPLHMSETIPEERFPIRYVGFSSSFRREAGSHGKDVRGILRVHQFDKVEVESFALPEHSLHEQDFMVAVQEYLLQSLELPYRVVLVCTGEMGIPDARQIDIETWFPGQKRYRETHTADFMSDYQARRLLTRVRRPSGTTEFVHMNDATVVAIGRTIAALLEVHQTADGTVRIPSVLRPYLGGQDTLRRSDERR